MSKEITFVNKYSQVCGEQLKRLRNYKRMSLRDLSERTGISYTAIRNYENGERAMDVDQIVVLCNAMKKNPLEFLDECFELIKKEEDEI